jgi:hypothetical protein
MEIVRATELFDGRYVLFEFAEEAEERCSDPSCDCVTRGRYGVMDRELQVKILFGEPLEAVLHLAGIEGWAIGAEVAR